MNDEYAHLAKVVVCYDVDRPIEQIGVDTKSITQYARGFLCRLRACFPLFGTVWVLVPMQANMKKMIDNKWKLSSRIRSNRVLGLGTYRYLPVDQNAAMSPRCTCEVIVARPTCPLRVWPQLKSKRDGLPRRGITETRSIGYHSRCCERESGIRARSKTHQMH